MNSKFISKSYVITRPQARDGLRKIFCPFLLLVFLLLLLFLLLLVFPLLHLLMMAFLRFWHPLFYQFLLLFSSLQQYPFGLFHLHQKKSFSLRFYHRQFLFFHLWLQVSHQMVSWHQTSWYLTQLKIKCNMYALKIYFSFF